MSATGAIPEPSRAFDVGQWATEVPVAANLAMSAGEGQTECANHTSGPNQPRSSM